MNKVQSLQNNSWGLFTCYKLRVYLSIKKKSPATKIYVNIPRLFPLLLDTLFVRLHQIHYPWLVKPLIKLMNQKRQLSNFMLLDCLFLVNDLFNHSNVHMPNHLCLDHASMHRLDVLVAHHLDNLVLVMYSFDKTVEELLIVDYVLHLDYRLYFELL